ncbi:hypothetical protein [Corynebacterium sp.]|jgi:hypothetical protein|uniref:hypothetical protein n=1 Tax=Corynebacterium sp. TaxID=1720 RepID=UPI0025BD9F63|nr:hypothetical protein [Corynebacterium sp.]
MTIKKSLLAAATAATVTIAGTGIAAAAEDTDTGTGTGTEETNSSSELLGSIEGSTETLGIINDFGDAVAGSISILPNINDAVNDFQDMVDDIAGKIPALPF